MRIVLTAFIKILILSCVFSQAELERRIDFSVENLPVSDALIALCEKANISISFRSGLLSDDQYVSFSYKNRPIKFLLEACLKSTEIGYKWADERLSLFRKPPPVFTISGFVEDSLSGERLVSATVYDRLSGKGTTTNEYGFYSLSIPRGAAALTYSYLGFNPQVYYVQIGKNLRFNASMQASITLDEIVVTDSRYTLQEGLFAEEAPNFASGKIKKMPAVGGEPDVFQYFNTLSGVQSGAGSFGGLHIRGGEADQNLVLLDGVPVYNATHSLGLFSIFNDNIVKSARLYKGKFPAKFGGRLSSVVDIQTKEGNDKKFRFGGGMSLFATNLFAEGPIEKEKTSFFVAARRTHVDPLFKLLEREEEDSEGGADQLGYYFYDFNAKINHQLSEKDRLYISFYTGADNFQWTSKSDEDIYLEEETEDPFILNTQNYFVDIKWGNTILSSRWNHLWHDKLFSNTTFTFSRFGFKLFSTEEFEFSETERIFFDVRQYNFDSEIQDLALKSDFDYFPNNRHHLKFGAGLLQRIFRPILKYQEFEAEDFDFQIEDGYIDRDTTLEDALLYATEFNFYLEDNIKIGSKLKAQVGFHNALFVGANASWLSFQPRFSLNYQYGKRGDLYFSYSRMGQFLHVLSPAGVTMPFDLWVPSTRKVRPQNSSQVLLGTRLTLPKGWVFGLEGYYKKLNHLITYGADVNSILLGEGQNFNWEEEVTVGEGWNYGMETSLKKTKGKTTGYLNYTWSRADRRYDELSSNQKFPFRYNRRHNLKLGLQHEFNPRLSVFATWVYGSGQPTTPRVIEIYDGSTIDVNLFQLEFGNEAPQLNNLRLPPHHRLDINVSWHLPAKRVNHFISMGLLNIYNRRNTLFSIFYEDLDRPEDSGARDIGGLPLFPSLRYQVKF